METAHTSVSLPSFCHCRHSANPSFAIDLEGRPKDPARNSERTGRDFAENVCHQENKKEVKEGLSKNHLFDW